MNIDIKVISDKLKDRYGLEDTTCKNLNTLANYTVEVMSPSGHFALKIYNPASRTAKEVQWEIDLTLHLIENGAPVVKPIAGKDN